MKRIIIKGKIKAITGLLTELAKKYDGWTVEDYIWLASLKKRFIEARKQKNFNPIASLCFTM